MVEKSYQGSESRIQAENVVFQLRAQANKLRVKLDGLHVASYDLPLLVEHKKELFSIIDVTLALF